MDAPIDARIAAELPSLVALRRDLHAHPELSYQEERTSRVVQSELAAAGVEFRAGIAGTGVLGYLPASEGAVRGLGAVALRADMDALPIVEQTGRPYASVNPGVMHACGHDGHTTILLGAARVLARSHRPRPVAFVFQPAEEGGGGADRMCREGVLAGEAKGGLGAPVERIFGLHGWPTFAVGKVASKVGPLLAATDDFIVTVRGTQSHGAYPQYGTDAIVAAAHVITALQTIVSRNTGPLDSLVITVGAINAGTANNIIPEAVRFIGTVRTLRAETKAVARRRLFEIVEGVSASMGCAAEVQWHDGYPVTHNDPGATGAFFETARATLGAANVETIEQATMGGEDFSFYGHHVPACFYLLGLLPAGATSAPTLHQPDFDFNDDAIPVGVRMMCALATR